MDRNQAALACRSDFDPYSDTSGFFSSIGHALTHNPVAKAAAKVTSIATKPLTVPGAFVAKKLGKVPVVGGVFSAAHRLAVLPLAVSQQVMDGGRIDKVALNNFKQALADTKTVGPWAQTVISFVPGIGTGVSAAIGAGLALAEGKPISQIMLAAVKGALPGGAAAQMAFNVAQGALERKPLDQIAIGALPISDQNKRLLTEGLAAAKDIASGKKVSTAILDHALKSLPPQYAKAVQIGMAMGHAKSIQDALKVGAKEGVKAYGGEVLKKVGGLSAVQSVLHSDHGNLGKVAGNLLGTMQGGLTGKNLTKVGLNAAQGVMPGNIQKAIDAANALKSKSPALMKALNEGMTHFKNGSHEQNGFAAAIKTLGSNPNLKALGAARKSLATEGARRAFDSAIGTISSVAKANPRALTLRAGSIPVINLSRQRGGLSAFQPNLKSAIDTLKRNPTMITENPLVLANKMGTTQQTVLQALKHVEQTGTANLPWRSLSPRAANFVRKWFPHAPLTALTHGTSDTSGLDESGTKYIVAKGDSPWSIAQKLSGNGNNWKLLIPLNKDKKPSVDKSVWTGEVLNIPPAWQKPVVTTVSPGPAASTQPAPARPSVTSSKPKVTQSVMPSVLQAKSILVAWSKTDGVNQAGLTDYGQRPEDLSTTFGDRDSLVLTSFQNWDNKTGNAGLKVDGILGPKSLAELQHWAEKRAAQSTPVVSSTPGGGTVTTLPEIVIEGSVPGLPPVAKPPVTAPPIVATPPALPPVALPPVASAPPIVATPPALPPVAVPTPKTETKTADSGGSLMLPIAGAVVGGLVGGPIGAVVGGVGGAMMS